MLMRSCMAGCFFGASVCAAKWSFWRLRGYQGLSRINLREKLRNIKSIIIRKMCLDDIIGSEYAFLSERTIVLQKAQAADYIVFSSDL